MWKFLNFGSSKRPDREGPATVPPVLDAPAATQHVGKRRELVRVVLRDTLRKNGIPVDWVGFDMLPLVQGPQQEVYLLHLVVMKWHAHLMDFAPAIEEQLWRGLIRFVPDIDRSELILGWRFAPGCGCPFDVLPEPAFWSAQGGTVAAVAAPAPAAPKKFDLPPSEYDHRSSGFAPTQPGELS